MQIQQTAVIHGFVLRELQAAILNIQTVKAPNMEHTVMLLFCTAALLTVCSAKTHHIKILQKSTYLKPSF